MKRDRAFSLIELMVTIAVVVILAGLVLPAFHRARERARSAQCRGNLKQWGVATQLFVGENNGLLPMDGFSTPTLPAHFVSGWYIQLPEVMGIPPYIEMPWRTNAAIEPGSSVWICPVNPRRSNGNLLFHYCLNSRVNGSRQRIALHRLSNPAATVWLFDNGRINAVAQQNNVHTNLHESGAHFLFLDGHVQRFQNAEYWDFEIDRGRTNNPVLIWSPLRWRRAGELEFRCQFGSSD